MYIIAIRTKAASVRTYTPCSKMILYDFKSVSVHMYIYSHENEKFKLISRIQNTNVISKLAYFYYNSLQYGL